MTVLPFTAIIRRQLTKVKARRRVVLRTSADNEANETRWTRSRSCEMSTASFDDLSTSFRWPSHALEQRILPVGEAGEPAPRPSDSSPKLHRIDS